MTDEHQPERPKPEKTSKTPKFLAPMASAGDGRGYRNRPKRQPWQDVVVDGEVYTDQPRPETLERIRDATSTNDEPECASGAWVDFYAESARFYESLQHQANVEAAQIARRQLSTEARIADGQRRAKMQRVNLSTEFLVARKMLDRARKAGRREDKAIEHLERIEAKLDNLGGRFQDAA